MHAGRGGVKENIPKGRPGIGRASLDVSLRSPPWRRGMLVLGMQAALETAEGGQPGFGCLSTAPASRARGLSVADLHL